MLRRTLHQSAHLALRVNVLAMLVLTFVGASPAQVRDQSPQPTVTIKIIEESIKVDTGGDDVIIAFASKSFHELRSILNISESPDWSEQHRNILTARLRERADMRMIDDPHATAVLRERLLPVLRLFESEDIEIGIFDDEVPNALTLPGVQIAFSTGLLKLIRRQDDLWFVAAHELAHKYTGIIAAFAQGVGDYARLRKIELICDTVAIAALAELGRDPRSGKETVARSLAADAQSAKANDGSGTHPSYRERMRVIEMMSRRLGRARVTGGRNIGGVAASKRRCRAATHAGAR